MATELTPLQQPVDEFNQLISDQDREQSLFSILTQRPFVATLAFTLFCLVILLFQTLTHILVFDWSEIPQVTVEWANIVPSPNNQSLLLSANTRLDISLPSSGIPQYFLKYALDCVGDLEVSFERTQVSWNNSHLVFVDILGSNKVNISGTSHLESKAEVYDLGHRSTLQELVDTAIEGSEVEYTLKGAVLFSKFGITCRVPFSRKLSRSICNGNFSSSGTIDLVSVVQGIDGLLVDVIATYFGQANSHIFASIPPTDWSIKIPDCKNDLHEVCQGHVGKLGVALDQESNVTVGAIVKHLPGSMIALCSDTNKSPLDTIVSQYLAGQVNYLYVQGVCKDRASFIGRALDGIDIKLPISGKPFDDKLVEWVQVHQVSLGLNGFFSGEAIVSVHLPKLFNIDPSAVFGAQNIRGDIILGHNGVDFGKITLEDWNPCHTSKDQQDYIVQVYFNHVPFEVLDARQAAIVSQYLVLSGSVPVSYQANIDVDIISPVAHFLISDFALKGNTILERS